ncbi:MAG: helix-turn-helix domain-containing protein [Anaerolineae bacterium]
MDMQQTIPIRNRIIGILVKRARLKAGKSQQACAEFLGCSVAAFRQFEQGRQGFSLPQLEALAYFLGVPPVSLWDDGYPQPEGPLAEPMPLAQMMILRRKILAVQFRQCRLTAGLTQQELGRLLGCSQRMISEYERGSRDIPLAQLEIVAERCGKTLDEFLDEQTIPLSPAEQDRRVLARLNDLPPDIRDFVLNPTNVLYLRIAKLMSSLKADNLRQIAETLLDITY